MTERERLVEVSVRISRRMKRRNREHTGKERARQYKGNSRHKIIQDTLSETTPKNRDKDITWTVEKQGTKKKKDTRHSYVEDNTRHTQYPRQDKTHSRRVLQGRP